MGAGVVARLAPALLYFREACDWSADELHHVAVGVLDEYLTERWAGDHIAQAAELLQALRRLVAILRPQREVG